MLNAQCTFSRLILSYFFSFISFIQSKYMEIFALALTQTVELLDAENRL